ncbi:MAG: DNA polymerase III subunit delta [Proteobacteria bacterium]|nr:DNA polymerase III subunit delta [Pseudomonadota bacterium]
MAAVSLLKFIRDSAKKPPAACLIYGEETQLLEEARNSIIHHYDSENRYRVNLTKLQESDLRLGMSKGLLGNDAELFQLVCNGKPPTNALTFIEEMQKRIQPPDCLMIVLLEWDYKYKKAAWFKKLSEPLPAVSCNRLAANEAQEWINRFAAEQQLQLSDNALRLLSQQTEGNLFAAKQTIIKLKLTDNEQQPLDETAVRNALADGARYDILELADAIYAGKPQRALKIFHQLRADGIADTLIQWSVFNILNNIAAVKNGQRVAVWGKQLAALEKLAAKINNPILYRLTRQAAYADRVTKGVATGDSENILCGLIVRLATQQSGVKIALPHYLPE